MARVKFVTRENLTGKNKEAYEEQLQKSGSVTNMKKALLNSFETYSAYMGWYTSYARLQEVLGERDSIIYAHAISTTNSCLLCSLFFISDLKDIGEDPDALSFDEKEEVLVELAEAIVKDPTDVPDALFDKLHTYFTDEEIVVIVGFAGQMIATNTFNSVLKIDVDARLKALEGEFKPATWRDGLK